MQNILYLKNIMKQIKRYITQIHIWVRPKRYQCQRWCCIFATSRAHWDVFLCANPMLSHGKTGWFPEFDSKIAILGTLRLMIWQNPSAWRPTWHRDHACQPWIPHDWVCAPVVRVWWLVTSAMACPEQSLPLTKRSHFGRILSVLFLISTLRLYRESPTSVSRLSSNKPMWKRWTWFKHSLRDVQTVICSYTGCTILNATQTIIMY